jgi:TonB family protein
MLRWQCGLASVLFFLSAMALYAQTSDISVQRYEVPGYPAIAKTARIEGDVLLQLKLAPNGDVVDAKVISGSRWLQQASLDAVKKWKYYCKSCKYGEPFEHQITFAFRSDTKLDYRDVSVEFKLPSKITVTVGPPLIQPQYSQLSSAI